MQYTGEIFAICPVDETAVEPVTDSSRYFVMKIQDGSGCPSSQSSYSLHLIHHPSLLLLISGRHAFVGMGFTERNDAFDFNTTILDHLKYVNVIEC